MFEFKKSAPQEVFLSSQYGMYTYNDLDRFTAYFHDLVVKYSESLKWPVAFMAESSDMLVFSIAACWKLGIPFVPLSPKLTDEELENYLNELNPPLVFCDSANINRVDLESVVLMDENFFLTAFNYDAREFEMPKASSFKDSDIFGYFFTSGTSEKPKIVPLKRRQILHAAHSSAKNFKPAPNHFWLLCLPLNHIGGIAIILRSLIYRTAIYRMNEFHEEMIREFLMLNPLFDAASLVPTMLKRLLQDPQFRTHREFKAVLLGGGPLDQDLLKKAVERGIPVVSSYGMTETCAQFAANMFHQPSGIYTPMTSVGKPFSPNEVEIRDEDGRKLGPNQSGLIWVKGPQVFDGYFNKEQNKGRFDKERWFNTGDFGHMNMRKQLFIETRRSDLIITGGENVNPTEVEQAIERLNYIREAAVIGVQDEEWGQKVVAFVVPEDDSTPELNELKEHLQHRLSDFKMPKELHIVDELPKTNTGKIKKWMLNAS
jgi:O-succinylbenzoic acid--CoA ligase